MSCTREGEFGKLVEVWGKMVEVSEVEVEWRRTWVGGVGGTVEKVLEVLEVKMEVVEVGMFWVVRRCQKVREGIGTMNQSNS